MIDHGDHRAQDMVDRVLAACGGGEVLVVGKQVDEIVRAWRQRGVPARAGELRPHRSGRAIDVLWWDDRCGHPSDAVVAALGEAEARATGVLVVSTTGPRDGWERRLLRRGWRKHPLYQQVVDYASLERETAALMVFEPVPAEATWGRELADLSPGRDLHMDMLREDGRRADAHVARYMWARRFVRPGDRVLDAACGLGYGSRVLAEGTLARSVLGVDLDPKAITYASEHYRPGHPRLSFTRRDLGTLDELAASSFDVVVSFETVEHLPDPEQFLAACHRLLTPGGRFLCSVPNRWVDEHGVDPNPHHLHVFDRARLEAVCGRHFMIEHVYGQTAGGGMKLPGAPRALWEATPGGPDAEWWLAVGMTRPLGAVVDPVATRWQPDEPRGHRPTPPTIIDFATHYEHPWLVRALVSIGLRTESLVLREQIIDHALEAAAANSADRGAALCVRAYTELGNQHGVTDRLMAAIEAYCAQPVVNPHAARWQISLRYVQGLAALGRGDRTGAIKALRACALADPLTFSGLLATKSVGACWLLGWLAAQERDTSTAAVWWRAGVDHAERVIRKPWPELMVDRDRPVLFGLREAAAIVDLASQCAAGLHALPYVAECPGVFWSLIADSMATRAGRHASAAAHLEQVASRLQSQLHDTWKRCEAAEAEVARLQDTLVAARLAPLSMIGDARRVAIFGTGQGGRRVLTRLRERGVRIECFADNDQSRWNRRIDELPVVDPATLPERGVDFVAVASAPGREAICAQLAALGYQEGRDFAAII